MACRLLLLLVPGLALCAGVQAAAAPRIEVTATPAWQGWSRPGRVTELDIRVGADTATRATLDAVAGHQTVHADLELQPGRVVRLQLPLAAAATVAVSVALPGGGTPQRVEIGIAQSESPLLGVALAGAGSLRLAGFHSVALAADDLPRNAAAYSSIDALVLDAPTLGALDPAQLGALLTHAAACGRIVVVAADARVQRVLAGAGGCAGRALMHAASPTEAVERLGASLATALPVPLALADIGGLARPGHPTWERVAVALALYFAAAVLVLVFARGLPALLLAPAVASLALVALLHLAQPRAQLVVWSEGDSGASLARYQAWQRHTGQLRRRVRVPIPPQLAASAQPCAAAQPVRFDFEAGPGRMAWAEFETRLFREVWLCYAGSFPLARALATDTRADGTLAVTNTGTLAWPQGALLASGRARALPSVAPGASAALVAEATPSPRGAALRKALARTGSDGVAALWDLDLTGVAGAPVESQGWLLVAARTR